MKNTKYLFVILSGPSLPGGKYIRPYPGPFSNNLELKQVDTKTFLAMKGYVTFVQVTAAKSKMKIISY